MHNRTHPKVQVTGTGAFTLWTEWKITDHHLDLGDPLNSILTTLVDAAGEPPVTLDGDLDLPLALRPGVLATERSPDDPDHALPGPVGSLKP